jgi:hypothetical protein
MSDYLAVGGVTAVLRSLLTTALTNGGPSSILGASPGVTALSPDLISVGQNEQPQLNLFMYYVSLNASLRNIDLPSMDGQGRVLSNPPLALDLHYLLSAYGSTQLDPEILLAWAMKVFHDTPVVPSQTIQTALSNLLQGQPSAEARLVAGSTLADQVEHLRITPETLTTEEIYRLWAAFQTAYRPSTAMKVSVVVVQDTNAYSSALPVQSAAINVQTMQGPVISGLSPAMAPVGQVLTIMGANFLGSSVADTLVSFDGAAGIAPDSVLGSAVRVTLPGTLEAGTRTVRVQRLVTFPSSPTPHPGFSSQPAPFQLLPNVQETSPVAATAGTPLTITVSPAVGRTQQATLYLGDLAIPIDSRPVGSPDPSTTLTFPIPSDLDGAYPLRVEVDGAQSPLTGQPGGGFAPQVQVST